MCYNYSEVRYMNNKKMTVLTVIVIVIVVVLSFVWSFFDGRRIRRQENVIKEEVINYLKDKYHEDFVVNDLSFQKNTFDVEEDDDYVTKEMKSSLIYRLSMSSSRLINFDVLYVVYSDEDEYKDNAKYNILEKGIYENYIYQYKIRDIKREIKSGVLKRFSNSINLDVSIDHIALNADNILVDRSLDSKDIRALYDEYRSLDKSVSNIDFYRMCSKISEDVNLIINLSIRDYIEKDDVDEFSKEVVDVVRYIQDLGYDNYDINISFKNYQSANISKYFVDDEEKISLIFDYENYSDVADEDKLSVYVLDKD